MKFKPIKLIDPPTGATIKQSRREAGITQAEMALALGLFDASRISKLEHDVERTSASTWTLWLLMSKQYPKL